MANANSRVLYSKSNNITQHFSGASAHSGIDITAAGSSTDYITAHSDGEVVMAGLITGSESYGYLVKIKHMTGYYTLYAHMAKGSITVKVGSYVKRGDKIGQMGSTGTSTGVHLHFEIRKGSGLSTAINPYPYINADLPNFPSGSEITYYMNKYRTELAANAASSWASTATAYVKNKGITDGSRPRDYVTREEVMQLISNFHSKK